jgi:LysM repeat protein
MTNWPGLWRSCVCLFSLLFLSGCFQMENSYEEEKDPHFIDGKNKVNSMDYDGAIDSFEKALQANPRSAAAHFELGFLYEQKNDFGAAIYHYQRHLRLRPNSAMAEVVKGHITGCTREMAKTVSVAVVNREVQRDLERLTQTNSWLMQRVVFLEAELNRRPQYITNFVTNWLTVTQLVASAAPAGTVASTPATGSAPQPRQSSPSVSVARPQPDTRAAVRSTLSPTAQPVQPARTTHVVRSGETLASIGRRYGVSIEKLRTANPGLNPNKIKPGQSIVVPAR